MWNVTPLYDATRCSHVSKCFFLSVACETCCFFVFAVCNKMTKYRAISPFLCMDMTYITCLLKEGFGFKDNTVLQVSKSDRGYCGRGYRGQKDTKI